MNDPLQGLNADQRRAVKATDGPVLVLAGAGSGKTRTLTHRLAYLVAQGLARPEALLAVTFTNRAAREMRERTAQLVGAGAASAMTLGTFHSLGARLLREQHQHHTHSAAFTILDASDSERLIRRALEQLSLSPKEWSPRSIRHALSQFKQRGLTPAETVAHIQSATDEVHHKIYAAYEALLRASDAFDFDDLIMVPISILAQHAAVRQSYQQRWRYVSVDEYQDTNPMQDQLIRLLLGDEHNLCVVGDDYQAIYSWRGAKVDHILRFTTTFPNCTTVYLTQNYRSTPAILTAANHVIAHNAEQHHKQLWTDRQEDTPVTVTAWPSDRREAAAIRLAIESHLRSGGRARDCAVLYRTNAQSRVFEEEFMRAELPYTIVGGLRFYQRAEVKDAMAHLQLVVNPNARLSFERLASRLMPGIGPKAIERLVSASTPDRSLIATADTPGVLTPRQHQACQKVVRAVRRTTKSAASPTQQLTDTLGASGYLSWLQRQPDGDDRMDNIRELITVAEYYPDVAAFVEAVSLLSDIDEAPTEADRVLCLTLHAAKGLEFPHVFIVGCEDALLPHRNSHNDPATLAEERRLFYVGLTRAIDSVSLHYATSRSLHGETIPQLPSRFLQELPDSVVTHEESTGQPLDWLSTEQSTETAVDTEPHYHSADVGDTVVHRTFGRGVVIESAGSTVTCVFEGHGVKVLDAQTIADSAMSL